RRLRQELQKTLPDYMVPSAFALLDRLPLSPNGKVDRGALSRLDLASTAAGPAAGPRTHLEEALVQIWSAILRRPQVGIHDNFFEIGGHSLLATQVIARIESTLGARIALRQLFEAPRIADLATTVEAALASGGDAPLPPLERADHRRPLPLSHAQERLWLFEQTVPGTSAYNTCRAGHLRGALDFAALEATLDEIVRRHEILRTRYAAEADGHPVQIVEPHRRLALPLVDLQGLDPAARQSEVLRLGHVEHNTPMPLDRAPLLRVSALRLAADEHVVLLSIHHISYDMWTGNLLLAELEQLYLAAVDRRPSPLPEPVLQYADYAVWQRRWLQGDLLAAQREYWRERLAGRPSVELPLDRPRPAVETFRGSAFRFAWPGELLEGLRQLAQTGGATQFMTALAVYAALLDRYSPQPLLALGTAISNRNRQELENVMGFFENIVVLALDSPRLDGPDEDGGPDAIDGLGGRAFLGRVREAALGAYAHQHYPFELLQQDLYPARAPELRTTFLFELNHPVMTRSLAGLEMKPYSLRPDSAKFELGFSLREEAGRLLGQIEYNVDLFEAATVQRMAAHYAALLSGMVREPDRPLPLLSLLSAAEHHQLTQEWNDSAPAGLPPALAPGMFARQARRRPTALAVAGHGGSFTYGELAARAAGLARRLRALGVGPESRVGVCALRSPELVLAHLAVWTAGGAYVPLDLAAPVSRLLYQVGDTEMSVVLADEAGRAALAGELPDGVTLLAIADGDPGAAAPSGQPDPPPADLSPDHLAFVIYTSGSTGTPKGAELTHRTFRQFIGWHLRSFAVTEEDRTALAAGVAFDASAWEIWTTLAAGASLHVPDELTRTTPQLMRDWLLETGVTVTFLT
ncbi:MAG TPA: condensation domain-containing protein, partial [Thermoanaerobaculia bacterium]|nr:condensation domain-containing protein [Thermoanaerobaculia bacterium]